MQTCVGFLLTVATIRGVAWLQPRLGWGPSLAVLALGPAFGIYHTWRLGRMDEATKMASGNR
jgi:hypothetical protein